MGTSSRKASIRTVVGCVLKGNETRGRNVVSFGIGTWLVCKITAVTDSTHEKRNRQSTRTIENTYVDTKSLFITGWNKLLDQVVFVPNELQYSYYLDTKTDLDFFSSRGNSRSGN